VANYGSGSVSVLPIQADGRLGEATAFVQHHGSSVNKDRQEGPHAHCIILDPANKFAFVADLGLDKVMIYHYDAKKGTLTPNDPPSVSIDPGSGPRHMAFHPSGRYAYVINEMASTVTALDYDAERGALKKLQMVSTLPERFKGETSTAEIVAHPSGKFLYGSNRGQDSIAVFAIDPETGKLTAKGHQGEKVKTPRNFTIDPTATYVLVGNQGSDSIVVFRIDPDSGELKPTGTVVDVPVPVCISLISRGS
jgi:6-phosphogluconolactonase